MEGKQMSVVQDLLLYIVFNCVMGSFACFWSLSHYLCKWALCVVIKCSSAAEKCKWMGQTEQQVLVAPHGHAKPGSDSEATKGKVLHCDSSRRAFHFFFFLSPLLFQNIMNYFTLFSTGPSTSLHSLRTKLSKQCLLTGYVWLSQ